MAESLHKNVNHWRFRVERRTIIRDKTSVKPSQITNIRQGTEIAVKATDSHDRSLSADRHIKATNEEEVMRLFDTRKLGFVLALGVAVLFGGSLAASAQGNSRSAHEKNRIRKEQKAEEKALKHGYRLYRGDNYYETDQRGVDLMRRAIESGYQQGYKAGANDRLYRRLNNYRDEVSYRSGNYGYQNYVDLDQYQHYFREGFERGYSDGYGSAAQYGTNTGGKWAILGNILDRILNARSF